MNFPAGEGKAFQTGQQRLPVQPLGEDRAHGLRQEGPDLGELLLCGVAGEEGDRGLENAVVHLDRHVLRQPLF